MRELAPDARAWPFLVRDLERGDLANIRRLARPAVGADRHRFELDAERVEIRARRSPTVGAQRALEQLAGRALCPPRLPRQRGRKRGCELAQGAAAKCLRPQHELAQVARRWSPPGRHDLIVSLSIMADQAE